MRTATAAVTLALLAAIFLAQARHRGSSGSMKFQCLDSAHCGVGNCCVVRPDRYSMPSCHPHGQLGDMCRPSASPYAASLSYPDGSMANVTNAHYIMCACALNLTCSRGRCVESQSAWKSDSVEED